MDFTGIDPQPGDCLSRFAALRDIDGKNPPGGRQGVPPERGEQTYFYPHVSLLLALAGDSA
jgi:hypothetical protein